MLQLCVRPVPPNSCIVLVVVLVFVVGRFSGSRTRTTTRTTTIFRGANERMGLVVAYSLTDSAEEGPM
jgi:hypothetical protein